MSVISVLFFDFLNSLPTEEKGYLDTKPPFFVLKHR